MLKCSPISWFSYIFKCIWSGHDLPHPINVYEYKDGKCTWTLSPNIWKCHNCGQEVEK
jgi:hypothetical protein